MTPQDKLIVCPTGTSMAKAQELLQKNRIEKLLIVDENFTLTGMITVKDIMKSIDYPHAVQDSNNRLLVGAAVALLETFWKELRNWFTWERI
jgi:IMP dehydrogenase